MKPLYLPSDGRRTSGAERLLERMVQDTVRTDTASAHYALVNAFVGELERFMTGAHMLEARPWRADVRSPSALRQSEDTALQDVSLETLLYAPPDTYSATLVDTYTYTPTTNVGMLAENGTILSSSDVDRCVTTQAGLLAQSGNLLYRLTSSNTYGAPVIPSEDGIFTAGGEDTWAIASLDEDRYAAFDGQGYTESDVAVRLSGLTVVYGAPGRYITEMTFLGYAVVEDGDDISALPNYVSAGHLYDPERNRIPYTEVDSVITISNYDAETTYRLYYNAKWTVNFTSPRNQIGEAVHTRESFAVSFSEAANTMYRLPSTTSDIVTTQITDIVCNLPGVRASIPIEASGFVGRVHVGHPIKSMLASEHYILVADDHTISLVEHDAEVLVLQQTFPEFLIRGLTWTPEGELGLIHATEEGFDLYALRDVRKKRYDSWVVAE